MTRMQAVGHVRPITITMLMLTGMLQLPARGADSDLLDSQRWSERAYGVSFQPPLNAKMIEQTADNCLVRILDGAARYQITVNVKRSRSDLTVAQVAETARTQIADANPSTRLMESKDLTIGGLPAERQYFAVPMPSTGDAMVGQTIIQINPRTYAILEVNCGAKDAEQTRQAYEAMLGTFEVADLDALTKQRKAALELTEKWRAGLNEARLRAAMGEPIWYRVLDERQRDIGWMQVTRGPGEFNMIKGVQVVAKTHLEVDRFEIDTQADYFRPFDTPEGEAWSVRSSVKRTDQRGEPQVAVETGSASLGTIEVRLTGTGASEQKDLAFERPTEGYLPQAEAWLLPWLLPHDTAGEYGFYWYNSTARQMTFRMDRVTPTLSGYMITTRLSPNEPELRATYDREGNLVEKDLGQGRKMVRSDAATLKRIWKLR